MKKYYALLLLCLFTVISTNAQGYNLGNVKKIEEKIDQIRKDGKNELKLKLKAVSERLKNKEITKIQADKLKDSLKTSILYLQLLTTETQKTIIFFMFRKHPKLNLNNIKKICHGSINIEQTTKAQ